ncbi:MAG TPA: CHAT domain-containing protein [Acidobacteriaceae bacterium]
MSFALSLPFLIFPGTSSGQASAASPLPEVSLQSGPALNLSLQPRKYTVVHAAVDARRYSEIRITLADGGVRGTYLRVLPQAAKDAPTPDPIISDSGESFVIVPILPGAASTVNLQVTALTNSRSDTAPVPATLSLTSSDPAPEKLLYAHALAAFNKGERLRRAHTGTAETLAAYKQAADDARQLHDPVLLQRALMSAGRSLTLDGKGYAQAVDFEKQAVAVGGTDSAPDVQAMAWKTLGGALLLTADFEASRDASERALTLYRKTGNLFWQGVVLENLGTAQMSLGRLDEAAATDQKALDIARQLHDDFGVVEMLADMGAIHEDRGQYQSALDAFAEAVEVKLPSAYNPMQGEAWASLGRLHEALGEGDHAGEDFRRAADIAKHTSSGLDELDALEEAGKLELRHGNAQAAYADFEQGLTRSRELKLLRPQSGLLLGLARAQVAMGKPEEAIPLLMEAIELASSIHQTAEAAEAHSTLGDLAALQNQAGDAEKEYVEAETLFASIPDQAGMAEADGNMARVEALSGKTAEALQHLDAAMEIIENGRASFARGGLRTRYFTMQRATFDQAIALLMDTDRKEPGHGYAARAWAVAERARARSLLDEFSTEVPPGRRNSAASALDVRLTALDVQIRDLETRLAQAGTSQTELQEAAKLSADLHRALLAADELESRLRASQPAAVMGAAITPAKFAASLRKGEALLEYWSGAGGTYVWLLTSDGRCAGYTVSAKENLSQLVATYRRALLARGETPAGETLSTRDARIARADELAARLQHQLAAVLLPSTIQNALQSIRRLMLVADGPLQQLPFAALEVAHAQNGASDFLGERFELLREPSASFLLTRPATPPAASATRLAVFADPVYNLADPRLKLPPAVPLPTANTGTPARMSALDFGHLPRLSESRNEALAIQSMAGKDRTVLFTGFEASPANVRKLDWSKYAVAHFAVHAVAQPAGRNVSGILLSMLGPDGKRRDGVLWLRDIYQDHVAPPLVILSGCGTALGETIPGEGLNSLMRAFLISGAGEVGATLWSVDDAGMEALMSHFYQGLLTQKLPPAQALRQAQRAMRADSRFSAPYYWAGFVMEGRWTTR